MHNCSRHLRFWEVCNHAPEENESTTYISSRNASEYSSTSNDHVTGPMGRIAKRIKHTLSNKFFHSYDIKDKKVKLQQRNAALVITRWWKARRHILRWRRLVDCMVVYNSAAIKIQRWYRDILKRRRAANVIIHWWHYIFIRKKWITLSKQIVVSDNGARLIQRWYRDRRSDLEIRKQNYLLIRLQKYCRGYLQRIKYQALVQHKEEKVNDYFYVRCLSLCAQSDPITFDEIFRSTVMKTSVEKIAHGAFGDVFTTYDQNFNLLVFKVVSVRYGLQTYARQNFTTIFSDLYISHLVNGIRNVYSSHCINFVHLEKAYIVNDKAPTYLVSAAKRFETRCNRYSHHNYPLFKQYYIVYSLHFSGKSVSNFKPNTEESLSIVAQVLCALGVGETVLQFEHRDLHLDNILLYQTDKEYIQYRINDEVYDVPSYGILATIIDFSYSRVTKDGENIYRNLNSQYLEKSPLAVCRDMVRIIGKHWESFNPKTNLLWVQSIIGKLLHKYKEGRFPLGGPNFKTNLARLEKLWEVLENSDSATDFVSSGELFSILTSNEFIV